MATQILIVFTLSISSLLFARHSKEQSMTTVNPRPHTRAVARVTVLHSEAEPYDHSAGPTLTEIHLNEKFTGEIEGESPVRALQVARGDHSASLVSLQRFSGKLGGRAGTFVLQGSETVENGKIKAKWFGVPGSGTGALSGLRGTGGLCRRFWQRLRGHAGLLVRMNELRPFEVSPSFREDLPKLCHSNKRAERAQKNLFLTIEVRKGTPR